jgi:hypothetical protein
MSHASTCACCSEVSARTPRSIGNRPGLSAIEYRVGTHPDFLGSMVAGLTSAGRPALSALTTRETDDLSMALLDSWAIVADVLSFYVERLANESYLRTARDRISLQELGKLIGYQLGSGVAARSHLAFALEQAPEVPAAQSKDPGSSPPAPPSAVTLEAGLRVQSIPGPGEKPQTFETIETLEARPAWNAIPATTTIQNTPQAGDTVTWLKGIGLNLNPGAIFLLVGADVIGDRWDVRILEKVIPDSNEDRTEVAWSPGLGSINPPKLPATSPDAFVLRKRINVFGHNAPMWKSMSSEFKGEYTTSSGVTEWPDFHISEVGGNTVDLDGSHPDVVVGSWVVLSKPGYRELWTVATVEELSRAEFATSGKVTRLTLSEGENYSLFRNEVRETTVFAVSESLILAEAPDSSPVSGDVIIVPIDVFGMEVGRPLILVGQTTAGDEQSDLVRVESISKSGSRWAIKLQADLSTSYDRATLVVHGNVALATHGETVSEILGSGRAAQPFQRFTLTRSPLTHIQSSDPSGASSTLQVRVNGVRWQEAPTLYGAEPTDHTYAARLDEQGRRTVRFGDGVNGSRLPTGNENVQAEYRHGLGTDGNVAAGALSQLLDRPLGVKGVTNPRAATGGVDPEEDEAARSTMPLKVRTLGRAVSLLDYEDFARAFTGVSKAHAAVLPLIGGRSIVVTVAFDSGTATDPGSRITDLATALRAFGDPQVQVEVLPHHQTTFRLALRVAIHPDDQPDRVLDGVRIALGAAFSFDRRDFTEPVHRSEIVAATHSVVGVLAVDIDRLYTGTAIGLADRLLAQQAAVSPTGSPIPAGLLVIAAEPFDWLQVMT